MKKNKTSLLALFVLCAASVMAVPHRWVAEVSRMVPEEVPALQGETIELYPEITAYSEPFVSDTYQLFYQTNGMGGLYFSGAITTNLPVLFTPAMDVGGTSYSFYIGTTNSAGLCFRPHGTIRMKKSPGFRPNTIPLPMQRIDFANTAYTNAPWLLPDSAYSTTVSRASSAFGWGNHASAGYLRQGESLLISEPGGGVLFPSGEDAYALWLSYSGFRDSNDFFINLPPFSNVSQTLATWQWTRSYVLTNQPDLSGYLPLVGGELAENATLTLKDLYLYTTHSVNGVSLLSPPFGISATLLYPQDLQGTFTLATREWTTAYVSTGSPPSGLSGAQVTNIVESVREFHIDSYTNIIWRTVWSNGWMWVVAHTNYPAQ